MASRNLSARSTLSAFELHVRSLANPGRGCTFPCDAAGNVDMDDMNEAARNSYLGARALIGREYAFPTVTRTIGLDA